jgi:site-specific DNA-methyltransferase (adenine-specific)
VKTSTNAGDAVLDPFLGTAPLLVACEQLGRVGYGMEISPAYVAVSLQRLHDMGLTCEVV